MSHDINPSTRFATLDEPRATLADATGLFVRASTYLPHSPRHGEARGYRVFWLEAGALRFRDVVDAPRGYAILGRHSRAHVRLRGDLTIALRHFVLRARHSASGAPELHVADLLAPLPLYVDGSEEPQLACVVEGAFSGRLGAHAICALPFDGCASIGEGGGPGRGDRPASDDRDDDVDNDDDIVNRGPPTEGRGELVYPKPQRGTAAAASGPEESAVVRAALAPVAAPCTGTVRVAQGSTHVSALDPAGSPDAPVVLTLIGREGRRTVALSEEQLRGLVILGRYDRCQVGARVFSGSVSRMHMGISLCPEGVEVIDLASTHGLRVDGARVHSLVVERGVVVSLTDDEHVRIGVKAR